MHKSLLLCNAFETSGAQNRHMEPQKHSFYTLKTLFWASHYIELRRLKLRVMSRNSKSYPPKLTSPNIRKLVLPPQAIDNQHITKNRNFCVFFAQRDFLSLRSHSREASCKIISIHFYNITPPS